MTLILRHMLDYPEMLLDVAHSGFVLESRLGQSIEVPNFSVEFPVGQLFYKKGMQRKLGWLETAQIIMGEFDGGEFRKISPNLLYDYDEPSSAYGLRIRGQMAKVIEQLKNHPETRRAIVQIGDKSDAGENGKPCINSYQWMVRGGAISGFMHARSWDLATGFIYDTQVMNVITMIIGEIVGAPYLGKIYGNAASGHLYQSDIEKSNLFAWPKSIQALHIAERGFFQNWQSAIEWARKVRYNLLEHNTVDIYPFVIIREEL